MAFFNKKNDEVIKNNSKNNEKNNVSNITENKDDVFDEEFLNIIESKEDKKNDKNNNNLFVEDKDFEVVKNSIDDLKQQILRLQELLIQHINSESVSDKKFEVSDTFSKAVFKELADLHENVFENKKKLKSLDEKLSNLIDIYKDEVDVLKELNENLKKVSFNSNNKNNNKDEKS